MTRRDTDRPTTALLAHPSADLYGSDRVLLETIEGLRSEGIEVMLAVPAHGPLVAEAISRGASVRICPTPVLRKALLSPLGLIRLAVESLRSLVSSIRLVWELRPALIYVNTITIPLWPVVSVLTRKPLLIHVHEAEGSASLPVRKLLALPLFLADTLVTNSRFSVDVLGSSFASLAGRCTVITNGVAGPQSAKRGRAELAEAVRLVYVGRLSHRKGPDVVVDAVADLGAKGIRAELHIVGAVYPGNEAFEAGLRQRIEEQGLSNVVHLHGFQASVWPFLADADIVVVPSRVDEPFGNTAVEAMLAARPAVVSDTSGLREASAGFASVIRVSPASSAAIAEAVSDIVSSWATYRDAALLDAEQARKRNGIAGYRQAIAGEAMSLLAREGR